MCSLPIVAGSAGLRLLTQWGTAPGRSLTTAKSFLAGGMAESGLTTGFRFSLSFACSFGDCLAERFMWLMRCSEHALGAASRRAMVSPSIIGLIRWLRDH